VLLSIDAIDYEHLVHHDQTIDEFTGTGVSRYIAANRISHVFDLRGPSEPVDTACSSFFVGLGRAVEAMARGDVDQAIVAAVQMNLLPARFRVLRERGLLSAAGATRPFDHDGDGFVRSEGVGAVVLKPLVRALADRDHVYGVIRGVGVWHAGTAMGVTAPSSRAHQEAMARALAAGGVSVDSLGYIEAHGTGMPLGDASELDAIDQVFRAHGRDPARPCLLGAAKAALGHLEAASGIAALAKVVLVLEHGRAPGLAHLRTAARPFGAASGLRISATEQPLPEPADGTLRAGLLSYGLGGVSAFVVVERAPAPADPAPAPAQPELFVLSAQSPGVLQRYAEHILGFLAATPAVRIAQLVEAYRTGREAMGCRLAVIATTVAELRERLAAVIAGQPVDGAYASHGARAVPRTARAEPSELAHWVADRDLARLAVAYVTGADIPWGSPREPRAAFPSYPFDAERVFWISPRSAESGRAGRRERAGHGDRD
jgi:acyl transferase domain-containing protein